MGPRLRARHTPNRRRPCPKSLNIIPNKIGTVVSIKTEGITSLCLGMENSSVIILVSNKQDSLGMIVLGLVFPDDRGKIETPKVGKIYPAGM